jgi:putative lipoprotein
MRTLRTFLAIGAVAALAACSGGGTDDETPLEESPTGAGNAALDITGSWTLTSGSNADGDITPVEGSPVTMDVTADGAVSGSSGCNTYNGDVTIDGTEVSFGPIASTMMACADDIMAVESAYQAALGDVNEGALENDTLTLSGNGSELVYEPAS